MELSDQQQPQPDSTPTAAVAPSPTSEGVSVSAAFHAAGRLVRRLDRRADRRVELVTRGGDGVKLHPLVLAPAIDAIERLVGGAALNEIEPPADRTEAGKLPAGRVGLRAYEHAGAVVIEVTDDGRGRPAEALQHDAAVAAARVAVESIGGTLAVASIAGVGTTFTLRLPPTSAVAEALVVRIREARYVVPRSAVVQILPRRPAGWQPAAWFAGLLKRFGSGASRRRGVTLVFHDVEAGRSRRVVADEVTGREHVVLDVENGTARLIGGAVLPVLDLREPRFTRERAPRIAVA